MVRKSTSKTKQPVKRGRTNKKSTIVSIRIDNEAYTKLKRLHPNVSQYLRERVEYDITRKHVRRKRERG